MLSTLRQYAPWLAPVLVFGLVVFVHELGHFVAAKITGVYAPRFSIGFGPALWKHRWGETEYRLAALPLGGYVRLASRDDEAVAMLEGGSEVGQGLRDGAGDPNAMMPFGPRPIPPDRWFESKPLPARLLIMVAGVTMNAALAFVVLTGLALYYGHPTAPAVFSQVLPNSPASAAGLMAADSVVQVAGEPVHNWGELVTRVSASPGRPISIMVVHNGATRTVTVIPRPTPDTNRESGQVKIVGKIGAAVAPRFVRHPLPVTEAVREAWTDTRTMAVMVIHMVRDLATGRASFRNLSGPLGIAKVSVEAARTGFENLLLLIAFLSINVAVLNLLPIPILDGGQILINLVESIKGRPFSLQARENLLRVGLVAIGLLFLLVMYNDRCQVLSRLC